MKTFLTRAGMVGTLLLLLSAQAQAVETEVSDMDDLLRAKVAKHKAKQTSLRQSVEASSAEEQNESGSCGGVDIGNSVGNNKPGKAPKEIVVVITGDVINANNKCKK